MPAKTTLPTPFGPITLAWDDEHLCGIDLDPDPIGSPTGNGEVPPAVVHQLEAYLEDGRYVFDLPLRLVGTAFQRRVWDRLQAIPAGRTLTYGAVAKDLGTSPRAIGGACRANPCPLVVPCHRVIGATGLGGFAGDTSGHRLAVKRWLLAHEQAR